MATVITMFRRFAKIERIQELRRSFWRKAEAHDGVTSGGAFVVFTNDNPFVPMVDRAYRLMIALRGGYRYVG